MSRQRRGNLTYRSAGQLHWPDRSSSSNNKTPATPHNGGRVTWPCDVYLLKRLRCLGRCPTLASAVRCRFLFVQSYCIAFQGKVNPDSSRQPCGSTDWLRQLLPQKSQRRCATCYDARISSSRGGLAAVRRGLHLGGGVFPRPGYFYAMCIAVAAHVRYGSDGYV